LEGTLYSQISLKQNEGDPMPTYYYKVSATAKE
jgi:hypothetical protein